MPILTISYGLQYYDKAILGSASVFGIIKDLHLSTTSRSASGAAVVSTLRFSTANAGEYPAVVARVESRPDCRVALFSFSLLLGLHLQCSALRAPSHQGPAREDPLGVCPCVGGRLSAHHRCQGLPRVDRAGQSFAVTTSPLIFRY